MPSAFAAIAWRMPSPALERSPFVSNTCDLQPTVLAASTAPLVPRAQEESDWPQEITQTFLPLAIGGAPSVTGSTDVPLSHLSTFACASARPGASPPELLAAVVPVPAAV